MSSEVIIDIYSEFITEEEVQEAMEKFWDAVKKEDARHDNHPFLDKKINIKE